MAHVVSVSRDRRRARTPIATGDRQGNDRRIGGRTTASAHGDDRTSGHNTTESRHQDSPPHGLRRPDGQDDRDNRPPRDRHGAVGRNACHHGSGKHRGNGPANYGRAARRNRFVAATFGAGGRAASDHACHVAARDLAGDGTTDDGVQATAAASAAAVLGIEVPLTLTDDYWTERRGRAMGSDVHIVAGDAPTGVVDWAVAELERLEQCWSRFRPDSELCRLNAVAGDWTEVSNAMWLALTCAADVVAATDGRFDPTILDALERNGYDRTFELVIDDDDTDVDVQRAPGFAPVELDADSSRVRLPPGTRLDLGGIGKGLAADLVARGLTDRGARSVLVGLGGDLRARGETPEGGWTIPVEDPLAAGAVAFEQRLRSGAIVTSTTRMRTWQRHGRRYHHLIDPATGDSARRGVAAVVARAPDAWWAEGIAKAIVVAGSEAGADLARANKVHAWLFLDDGQVVEVGDETTGAS